MKKFKKILLLLIPVVFLSGCSFRKDNLEDATIYTTIYPVEYLVNFLYSDYGTVESIYPKGEGADITNRSLTKKQIKKYAKGNLFIYNGKSNENDIAMNLVNENQNLIIIDASNGITYTHGVKELWLNPKNYLMSAKNIKNYLIENLKSTTIKKYVEDKYNEIDEIISLKIAELESIGKEALEKGTNTIVVSDNALKFLEDFNFNIISLDEETITEASLNSINNNFKNGNYKSIVVLDNNFTENINKIIKDYNIKAIDVNSMSYITDESDLNYLNVMQEFIDNIRNITIVN